MKALLLIILLFSGFAFAEDIFLKNGMVYKNVEIEIKGVYYYVIRLNDQQIKIPMDQVEKITYQSFDNKSQSYIIKSDSTKQAGAAEINKNNLQITRSDTRKIPLLFLLPVSAISFGLSYDYFSDASDLSDEINEADDYNKYIDAYNRNITKEELKLKKIDISKIESKRSLKRFLGITFLAAGIVNTVVSFKSIEITSTPEKVNISYRFP